MNKGGYVCDNAFMQDTLYDRCGRQVSARPVVVDTQASILRSRIAAAEMLRWTEIDVVVMWGSYGDALDHSVRP